MRAAVFPAPGSIEVQDVATPEPAAGEARVRVAFCGVCGSDLHRFRGDLPLVSVTTGHEISGVVDSAGSGFTTISPGDRVCVEPIMPCGHCRYCSTGHYQLCSHARYLAGDANGGFAEFVILPATMLHRLPETMTLDQAARANGAGQVFITAKHPHQAEAARALGADFVIVGGFAAPQSIDFRQLVLKELRIIGSHTYDYGPRMHRDFDVSIGLVVSGRVHLVSTDPGPYRVGFIGTGRIADPWGRSA